VHVVADGEAVANMTYGDIEFDVVGRPDGGQLIDTSTGEIVWADEARGQDIEVENDETHLTERSAQPGHVRGVIQKRLPGTSADNFTYQKIEMENSLLADAGSDGPTPNESMSLNFEEVKQQIHTDPRDMFSEVVADQSPGDDMVGAHANTVTFENCLVSSVVASDADVDGDVQAEGVWQDDWESPIA
jgi:hypothetical protein